MLRNRFVPASRAARSFLGVNGVAARLAEMNAKLDLVLQRASEAAPAPPVAVQAALPPPIDPSMLLHQARTALVREMPPHAQRLLSAGCAGRWYFDWIEQAYGHVPEHIGIEFYSPRPDSLPDNVTWIANTASDMVAVTDGSCDLVFSGQNMEHLWADEVAGFLVEAARVLKPGGHLVVDSPNRELTQPLNWSHPEHTIELTVPEVRRLLELAGFDVTKQVGIWLCRDPKTGRILNFNPNDTDAEWSMVERLVTAREEPTHAFLWWLEASRSSRPADREAIDALLAEAYRHAWPERIRRTVVPAGRLVETRADGEWVVMAPNEAGMAIYGPYMPLRAGRHRISFDIIPDVAGKNVIAVCDVCVGAEGKVLQSREVTGDSREVTLDIEVDSLQFGTQFRCLSTVGGFAVRRVVRLEETLV